MKQRNAVERTRMWMKVHDDIEDVEVAEPKGDQEGAEAAERKERGGAGRKADAGQSERLKLVTFRRTRRIRNPVEVWRMRTAEMARESEQSQRKRGKRGRSRMFLSSREDAEGL